MKKLGVIIALLALSAVAFAQQYPMLEDVRAASVSIDHVGIEPNSPPINWPKLQLNIARKLNEAGISIEPIKGVRLPGIPDLYVTVMMIEIPETEQFVFHIETSLYRLVSVSENSKVLVSAPVWADLATMQSVAAEDTEAAITKAAMRQAGKFIEAWQAAQTKKTAAAEPNRNKNHVGQSPTLQTENHPPAVAATLSDGTYLASKNSKIFHKADCSTAKTVSQENVVMFASKDEALNSGRRPCKKCNP